MVYQERKDKKGGVLCHTGDNTSDGQSAMVKLLVRICYSPTDNHLWYGVCSNLENCTDAHDCCAQ